MKKLLLLILIAALFGCAKERRIAYVNNKPDMSAKKKEKILTGFITVGMTKADVQASWGIPYNGKTYTKSGNVSIATWHYQYNYVVFKNSRVTGWGGL